MNTITHYVAVIHYLDEVDARRKDAIESESLAEAQRFVADGIQRGYFRRAFHHDCFEYIPLHRILKIEIENWQETV